MNGQPTPDFRELYYETLEEALRLNGVVQDAVGTLLDVKDRMNGSVYEELALSGSCLTRSSTAIGSPSASRRAARATPASSWPTTRGWTVGS